MTDVIADPRIDTRGLARVQKCRMDLNGGGAACPLPPQDSGSTAGPGESSRRMAAAIHGGHGAIEAVVPDLDGVLLHSEPVREVAPALASSSPDL